MTNETKRLLIALENRLDTFVKEGKGIPSGKLGERIYLALALLFIPKTYIAVVREASAQSFRQLINEEAENV